MGIELVSVILKQVSFILAKQQDNLIVAKSKITLVNGDLIWDASD